jgi:hypothetical protein
MCVVNGSEKVPLRPFDHDSFRLSLGSAERTERSIVSRRGEAGLTRWGKKRKKTTTIIIIITIISRPPPH